MLIAAIASMTLHFLLRSPELLGYCSSSRNSRFFDSRYGTGSAIGGTERARIFKTLKMKLVDVGAETGSARLAVVQDDGTREGQPLKRGRLYCQVYDKSSRVLDFLIVGIREMVTWERRIDAGTQGPDLRNRRRKCVYVPEKERLRDTVKDILELIKKVRVAAGVM